MNPPLFSQPDVDMLRSHLEHLQATYPEGFGTPTSVARHLQLIAFYAASVEQPSVYRLCKANEQSQAADSDMLTAAFVLDNNQRCSLITVRVTQSQPEIQHEHNGAAVKALSDQLMESFKVRKCIVDLAMDRWREWVSHRFPVGTQITIDGMNSANWNGTTGTIEANASCAPGRLAVRTHTGRKQLLSIDSIYLTPLPRKRARDNFSRPANIENTPF